MVKIHCGNCPAFNPYERDKEHGLCSLHPPMVEWIQHPSGIEKESDQPEVGRNRFCLEAPGQAIMPDEQPGQIDQPGEIPRAVRDAAKEIALKGRFPDIANDHDVEWAAGIIWSHVKVGWGQ